MGLVLYLFRHSVFLIRAFTLFTFNTCKTCIPILLNAFRLFLKVFFVSFFFCSVSLGFVDYL